MIPELEHLSVAVQNRMRSLKNETKRAIKRDQTTSGKRDFRQSCSYIYQTLDILKHDTRYSRAFLSGQGLLLQREGEGRHGPCHHHPGEVPPPALGAEVPRAPFHPASPTAEPATRADHHCLSSSHTRCIHIRAS